MTDADRDQFIGEMFVKISAVRDVVVCLVAKSAQQSGSPDVVFADLSAALTKRIQHTGNPPQFSVNQLNEKIQAQYDWIIAAAQRAIGIGT